VAKRWGDRAIDALGSRLHVREVQLTGLDVLVVDCQTTGATPAHGVVLEIGWGVARAAPRGQPSEVRQLESHWITLPEGHRVPGPVRRLTGFEPGLVTETLAASEAWQRLRSAVNRRDPVPTAIHFAQFELGFLRDWARQYAPTEPFPLDVVCVHAIACRLFPDLPRRSIRALAGFLGHSLELERRCHGHVEATAFIWNELAVALGERGVHTWQELREWLAAARPARSGKRRFPLPSAKYRALPDEPGVYRFLRSNGDLLYVGKAASLRKRVASHFTAGSATTERALEMLTQVHDIRVTPTSTALEAALLENEEIKAVDPPYNIQLLDGDRNTWFFDRELDSVAAAADERHRRGPLPSTHSVRALAALRALGRGLAPTLALRARAVGTLERWAPDESVFLAGYQRFVERHELSNGEREHVDRRLLGVARQLLAATPDEAAAASPEESPGSGKPGSWDTDRVVRHLERGLAHAHQLLQRARWLCLLHDSDIEFQEAASAGPRWLSIRAGRVSAAAQLSAAVDAPLPYRSLAERQAGFDRRQYDRLRTLTSELKRVLRDGGSARLRIGRRWLDAAALQAGLRWI
jgi:DNA polymerase III subunit epsilon